MSNSDSRSPLDLSTRFALDAKELAVALGVSERHIRDRQSQIPHVRIGNRVLFPVQLVNEWLRTLAESTKSSADRLTDDIIKEMEG